MNSRSIMQRVPGAKHAVQHSAQQPIAASTRLQQRQRSGAVVALRAAPRDSDAAAAAAPAAAASEDGASTSGRCERHAVSSSGRRSALLACGAAMAALVADAAVGPRAARAALTESLLDDGAGGDALSLQLPGEAPEAPELPKGARHMFQAAAFGEGSRPCAVHAPACCQHHRRGPHCTPHILSTCTHTSSNTHYTRTYTQPLHTPPPLAAYRQNVSQLAKALREAIDAEEGGARETEVRRKADPAKELAKQFLRRWQDDPSVAGGAAHEEMKAALRELGAFYQTNGPRARLTGDAAAAVRARLDAVEAALPPEKKGLLGL